MKVEVSGKVEIDNDKTISNMLTNAKREYDSNNYDEAYKLYSDILQSQPDNDLALLRRGICKSYINNYIDYSLDSLVKDFDEVINIIKGNNTYEEKINGYVNELMDNAFASYESTVKFYNSYTANRVEIESVQNKLVSIYNLYKRLLEVSPNNAKIIEMLIKVIEGIIKNKKYSTGQSRSSQVYYETYKVNLVERAKYLEEIHTYKKMLNIEDDNEYVEVDSKESSRTIVAKVVLGAYILFLLACTIGSISSKYYLSFVIFTSNLLLTALNYIQNQNNNKEITIQVCKICNQPNDLIQCQKCKKNFHLKCLNLNESSVNILCSNCKQKPKIPFKVSENIKPILEENKKNKKEKNEKKKNFQINK